MWRIVRQLFAWLRVKIRTTRSFGWSAEVTFSHWTTEKRPRAIFDVRHPLTGGKTMVWGAAIGAGASHINSALQASQQKAAARKARDFNERMYRNRYQYTMEDMRKAGLNPILAYSQGVGGSPTAQPAQVPDYAGQAAAGAAAGTAATLKSEQRKLLKEQQTTEQSKRHQLGWMANQHAATAGQAWSAKDLLITQNRIAKHGVAKASAQDRFYRENPALSRGAVMAQEFGGPATSAAGAAVRGFITRGGR